MSDDILNGLSPIGRVHFPEVFVAKAMKEGDDPKFSLLLVFKPSELEGVQKELFQKMIKAADAASRERFKVGFKEEYKGKPLSNPFRRGTEQPDRYEEDDIFIRFSTKNRPGVVGPNPKVALSTDDFYPGCYARVTYRAATFDVRGNRGTNFWLNNVQKTADGERIAGGRARPEDEFEEVECESTDAQTTGATGDDVPF